MESRGWRWGGHVVQGRLIAPNTLWESKAVQEQAPRRSWRQINVCVDPRGCWGTSASPAVRCKKCFSSTADRHPVWVINSFFTHPQTASILLGLRKKLSGPRFIFSHVFLIQKNLTRCWKHPSLQSSPSEPALLFLAGKTWRRREIKIKILLDGFKPPQPSRQQNRRKTLAN